MATEFSREFFADNRIVKAELRSARKPREEELNRIRAEVRKLEYDGNPQEAAQRLGLTVAHFRHLLDGVDWRKAAKIPLITVDAVRKRMESRNGYSIEDAASRVGKTPQWVQERIEDGTISGEIRTLKFKTQARFVPVEDKASEQSPDFRIFAPHRVELGAGWKKVSDAGLTYYSVSLDDPSFTAPV